MASPVMCVAASKVIESGGNIGDALDAAITAQLDAKAPARPPNPGPPSLQVFGDMDFLMLRRENVFAFFEVPE
jgi:hypothetical protein